MKQLLEDIGAVTTWIDEKIYVNGVRFIPAKQTVLDSLRSNGEYGRYLRACREELAKEEKLIGRAIVRVSNELIDKIFKSSQMDM